MDTIMFLNPTLF